MYRILFFAFLFLAELAVAQVRIENRIENIIIVTTDGLRWQEVFGGMDSTLANMKAYNEKKQDYIFKTYWADTPEERRAKLMPFFWSTIASQGNIYGNRRYANLVNNANPYSISYPGYNEIFTGYPDTAVNSNNYKANPNVTVLEFLNRHPQFAGRVAAFVAWEAFDRILNEKRAGFPVVSAFDSIEGKLTQRQQLLNAMKRDSYRPFGNAECLDVFTHYEAIEHLRLHRPKVLYVAYGETDEWAHHAQYRSYLDAARQVDKWIEEIWNFVQSHPAYRNKTALLFTTDHGRGDATKSQWTGHNKSIPGASDIWMAVIAPGLTGKGELKTAGRYYQKQFAQTIASLLGLKYTPEHPVGEAIHLR